MNIIILTKNFENYVSGYYHHDINLAYMTQGKCFLYGDGYPGYDEGDSIDDVIAKSPFDKQHVDLIVVSTTWEFLKHGVNRSDPHPNINLKTLDIPKVYYLNKEYIHLESKLEYARSNNFDLVITMYPDHEEWSMQTGLRIVQMQLGVNLDRFKDFGMRKTYDFGFTGSLQKQWQDMRYGIKNLLMKNPDISSSVAWHGGLTCSHFHDEFQRYTMMWSEWGSSNRFTRIIWPLRNHWARWEIAEMYKGRLLPSRKEYPKFLSAFKVFLSTLSHEVIVTPRYYQCMASKTLLLIPESKHYGDFFSDQDNCIMFKPDLSDFKEKLHFILANEQERNKIIEKAQQDVRNRHSYQHRVVKVLKLMNLSS